MKPLAPLPSLMTMAIAVGTALTGAGRAEASYVQTNLVSDIGGLAIKTDPSLKNPWGISFFGTSPFWISDQGTNESTLYAVTGSTGVSIVPLTVDIPTTATGPQGPTGQVANTNPASFPVGNGGNGLPAHFIFANLNGTISAWNTPGPAFVQPTPAGAVYTGLAINQADTLLYAANGAGTGSVNVFNSAFGTATTLPPGAFATPAAIGMAGLVPFNVQDIGGAVYVTYALSGHGAQAGAVAGDGAVAVFNESGVFQSDTIGGQLASPWGIALAPASFAKFGGDLLVGNFSYADSIINAFNPNTWAFEGSIPIDIGGNSPGGLWDLTFGGESRNGSPNTLYFADGINGEQDGLFGAIASVREPSTWAMLLAGFAALGFAGYGKSKIGRQPVRVAAQ